MCNFYNKKTIRSFNNNKMSIKVKNNKKWRKIQIKLEYISNNNLVYDEYIDNMKIKRYIL